MADDIFAESLPADAELVSRARARIADYAAAHGASGECLDAIKLAASEALTNVVVHAYGPERRGEMHVTAAMAGGDLWVLVSDDGQGLQARSERAGLGLGLVLIAQLSDEFAIAKRSSGGTELRMRFALPDRAAARPVSAVRAHGSSSERTASRRGCEQLGRAQA